MAKIKVKVNVHFCKLLFLAILFFASGVTAWAQERRQLKPRDFPEMDAKVYDKVSAVTVKIICDGGKKIGSGSIVGIADGGKALILTACHVISSNFEDPDPDLGLEYYDKIEVKTTDQLQPVPARIVPRFVDRANDLALIATSRPILVRQVISYTKSDKIKPGQKVAALGYPRSNELSLTVGRIVTRDNPKYLVFDAIIGIGSSGGPVVDADGRMIGMSSFLIQQQGVNLGYATNMNLVSSIVNGWLQRVRLEMKWQFEKDRSFFTSPLFITGVIITAGAGIVGGFVLPSDGPSNLSTPPELPQPPDVN